MVVALLNVTSLDVVLLGDVVEIITNVTSNITDDVTTTDFLRTLVGSPSNLCPTTVPSYVMTSCDASLRITILHSRGIVVLGPTIFFSQRLFNFRLTFIRPPFNVRPSPYILVITPDF